MTPDFVCTNTGSIIVCPMNNCPCNPLCPFYVENETGLYATCNIGSLMDSPLIMVRNQSFKHPWKTPEFPESFREYVYPYKDQNIS